MKRLAIVVGHEHKDEGAYMCEPFGFVQEYEYNTILAAMIQAEALEMTDIDVKVFLRDGRGIRGTYDAIDEWEADASIELHFNSFTEPKVEGCLVIYGGTCGAKKLAEIVKSKMNTVLKNRDRGTEKRGYGEAGGYSVNGSSKYPRVLIEPFFGSNIWECEKALKKMPELSKAVLRGAIQYLFTASA